MSNKNRWATFSGTSIDPEKINEAIMDILTEYGDIVYQATEEGLDVAEKMLIEKLKTATPTIKNPPKGYVKKNFAKSWKGKGRKYRLRRYIGNTTTVKGKSGDIALTNIFEYSTTRGKPFIKKTFEESISEIAKAVVDTIKREV